MTKRKVFSLASGLGKKIALAIILALSLTLIVSTPAYALTAPDSISIDGVWAFRNLAETGDMAFLVAYDAYYADPATDLPTQLASNTMHIRLMDGATELGNVSPYPYYSNGYQKGIACLYFTAAQVTAKTMAWSGAYAVEFSGDLLLAWVAAAPTTSAGITEWNSDADQKKAFGNRIITQGLILDSAWGVNLIEMVSLRYFLTRDYGQDYFSNAITNLQVLAPQIFQAQSTQPIYKTSLPPLTYAPDELPVDPTPSAVVFGMSKGTLTTLCAFLAVGIFIMYLTAKSPGMGRYGILIAGVLIIFYTRIGAVVPIWATGIGVLALFVIGYLLFYEKSPA